MSDLNEIENIQQIFYLFSEESWTESTTTQPSLGEFFKGKKGEVFVVANSGKVKYFIGLGKSNSEIKGFDVQSIANKFSWTYKDKIQSIPTLIAGEVTEEIYEEFVKGLYLGTYLYPFEKSHPIWKEGFKISQNLVDETIASQIFEEVVTLCNGQFAGMEWLNKPANFKTVALISEFLETQSKKLGLSYKKLNREEAEKEKLGAFLAVNQGSSQDAAFTILEYKSEVQNAKTIGLVGKCVLFDTGGISIKPSDNMHYMKSDMGGASAVIGTIFTAAERKLPVNIVAILPVTDNAVSDRAYLPSDVIKAYNGKTIEVLNTDAEGRMTLADGLSYMSKNYQTDVMIDLATLTGSSVRMFGYTCGAFFSNDESLKSSLIYSGDKTNQRLWNLPLWDIWEEDFKSDVADFKNISSKPFGDCIIAGKFLEQFIEGHKKWAHLDIAGVAFGNVNYAKEKAATGYGVQLLLDFIKNYYKN